MINTKPEFNMKDGRLWGNWNCASSKYNQCYQNNCYTLFPLCLYSENAFFHSDNWKPKQNKPHHFSEVLGDVLLSQVACLSDRHNEDN